jgi:hypothetical protein
MDSNFNYQDYRDCFLAIMQGLITHNGLNMASEGHFAATVTNVDGLAIAAVRALASRKPATKIKALSTGEDIFSKDGGL